MQLTPSQNVISGPPPAADTDALLGATIGSFKITRKLGVGGMGTVYLGEQAAIGSKVAIKVLHEHLCGNASLVQRFYAEARAANVIGHEHIVSIIDLNVIPPSRYYFVMEYLEGKPLNELPRPMGHALMVHILEQACDALQAAHLAGVVHRDLKPENIILIRRGRNDVFVKLLDFGIAKLFATELAGQQTVAGMIMGTPEFMAPEQTSGEAVDGRTDLYALGVIAYELATARLPFSSPNLADLFIAHRMHEPKAPHLVNPAVPPALSRVILKALAKAPEARYQNADAFREALVASLDGLPHYRPAAAGSQVLPATPGGAQPPSGSPAPALRPASGDPVPTAPDAPPVVQAAAPPPAPKGPVVPAPPGAPGWKAPAPPTAAAGPPARRPEASQFAPPPPGAPGALQATSTPGPYRATPGSGLQGTSSSGSGTFRTSGSGLQGTSAPGGRGTPAQGLQATSSSPSGSGRGLGLQATSSSPSGTFRTSGSGLQASSRPGAGGTPTPQQPPGRSGNPSQAPSPVLGVTPSQPSRVESSGSGTSYEVRLYETGKAGYRTLRCTDVTRSGMFVLSDTALPAVFSQLKLGLLVAGRELLMTGEVVRHVTLEQSQAWGMSVGFGVQLTQLTAAQKETLAAISRGGAGAPGAVADLPPDPRADAALAPYRKHGTASFYELLGVLDDADFPEVRLRIREAKKALEELRGRPLSSGQREELEAYDRRLDEAHLTIGHARNRLDYDGSRGNWKGAARSIAGGVSVTELDSARRRYLVSREKVEGAAHLHFTTGSAWESQKELARAQAEYERALALDPLNLTIHQRYQALRRVLTAPPPVPRQRR